MRTSVLFVLLIILSVSCRNNTSVELSGTYSGTKDDYLQISKVNLEASVLIDSVKISKSGKFKTRIDLSEPTFYTLGFDENEFVTIVAEPGDDINIEFKGARLQNDYRITGSEESEKIRLLDKKLGRTIRSLDSLRNEYNKMAEADAGDDELANLEQLYTDKLNDQRDHNIRFILDNLGNLSAVKALYQSVDENVYVLYRQRDLQYLKLVSDSLKKYYPGISITNNLTKNLETELNQMYLNRISQAAEGAESHVLDANLENMEGERIRLSDIIQDNYVLLSFWSAESSDCISNNLFLKQMYRLYHYMGFEIYQVNLDKDEELWRASVRYDDLPWIHVREDDQSNQITARLFNVTSVPANYLFDKEGNIIGKNLFGRALRIKLEQIFD